MIQTAKTTLASAALIVALLCLPLGGEAKAESQGQSPAQSEPESVEAAPHATPEIDASDDENLVGEIFVETLVGGMAGMGGALGGALAGVGVDKLRGDDGCDSEGEHCVPGLLGGLIGGYAGYTTGVALGVYAVGTRGDREASFLATMAGSWLGAAGGLGLAINSGSSGFGTTLVIAGPIVGALVGLHATSSRRQSTDNSPSVLGSLVNVDQGKARLGVPMLTVLSTPQSESHTTIFQLVGGRL